MVAEPADVLAGASRIQNLPPAATPGGSAKIDLWQREDQAERIDRNTPASPHRLDQLYAAQICMNPSWIIIACSAVAQLAIFVRWLHRRTRDDEIRRTFVRDMAINHLPHIYQALRQIASHMGLELEEPPAVQFVELNSKNGER